MSHSFYKTVKRITFLTLFVLSFVASQNFAQDTKTVVVSLDEDTIGNLKNAITSDNPGLRKSGIYLAGKHAVKEVSETLVEQLDKENDPELKILILRVLFIIDENNNMDEIYRIAVSEENKRVKDMASALYSAIQINNSEKIAESSK